ncbi:MAG: methyltransferase domain-containing protein [Aeromicrobium sp.]
MATSEDDRYTLRLSEPERMRYRMMAAMALEQEAELWLTAGIKPGARVADVGCGPGAVLVEIARIVGTEGTVVGIEPGTEARGAAREELDAAGFRGVEVKEGNGEETGLEPGAWDCVMMRHVLTHTGAAADGIVAHLATLVAPGGHVFLVDTDLDASRVAPPEPDMVDQLDRYADFHRALGNDARIGSRLGSMLRSAGLEVVEAQGTYQVLPAAILAMGGPLVSAQEAMLASGVLNAEEVEPWEAARQHFAAQPGAELWMAGFRAIGRKPLV